MVLNLKAVKKQYNDSKHQTMLPSLVEIDLIL